MSVFGGMQTTGRWLPEKQIDYIITVDVVAGLRAEGKGKIVASNRWQTEPGPARKMVIFSGGIKRQELGLGNCPRGLVDFE